MYSAELHDMRQMVVRMSRLVEISVTLNSTHDLQRQLDFIVDSASDLLGSEAASILLVDDRTRDLRFAASTGWDQQALEQIPVPVERSILGTIFREDRPLILNDMGFGGDEAMVPGDVVHPRIRSLIGVPLRIRDEVAGVLEAVNKRSGNFNELDQQTLENIASQAAVAIHNARILERLQNAYEELGKLDRLKSDFIAIASHELRTPLGLILGYASLLKEDASEAEAEHAEAVLTSAMRMRTLIEAMTNLNMLRLGAGEMDLSRRSLRDIALEACEEASEAITTKQQHLEWRFPGYELEARVDGPKLKLALANLLMNASRFSSPGGDISLELTPKSKEAWFIIRDQGIGMSQDQLERIFLPFYQVEEHMTRRHGGMGLGLAIVKAVAEAHAGRVWAESKGENTGTAVYMAIPLAT
ncbi:MAG: GAF domain-containing protein [Anaerolineales bacterium]|nr:GAF domain-containing protein [Anaerolineales bacterium]